ncbi:LCP family protein [Streptomyces sp. ICBB 8177]|uniref:LCP family protein n=1 Tax=Streptomyces sp. ICBB 8177 TaxID=563922 RepID=UPI000D6775AF|nr:LCP family protein [Streptomyces sp. ICBB 8177]PWI46090.1 transcriptional regulator [Streptomyces sp. ICBB 8177]
MRDGTAAEPTRPLADDTVRVPAQRSSGGHRRGGDTGDGGTDDVRRRRGRRALKWVAIGTTLIVLGTGGAAYAYYQHLNGNLKKADLDLGAKHLAPAVPNAAGQTPLNILLLGSDSRNTSEDVELGGATYDIGGPPHADVEMLLHVSADRSNMTVISVPRDTRVDIPECTDPTTGKKYAPANDIITDSLSHGGPGCTVATWEELTGIPIDHFMMVDFAGVVKMADAVGGVPVCVDNNVYDKDSGLRLTKGTHVIQGQQALQWLRTRHGFEDGSDIGRTHAQHMYMSAMVRQLKSSAKLTDPGELMNLAESATRALTVDQGLGTVKKLYDLAGQLQKVPTDRITMTTMPWAPDPQDPDAHVVPTSDAQKLFAMVRGDIPVDGKGGAPGAKPSASAPASPSPSDTAAPKSRIAVTVRNGTGTISLAPVPGRAGAVTERLAALGFTRAGTDDTLQSQADTTITYPSNDLQADAQAVARALGIPASAVRKSAAVSGITLVVGSDWRTGESYPKSASSDPTKLPDTAAALNAGTDACMKVNVSGGYSW